jgi:hypothetical protein
MTINHKCPCCYSDLVKDMCDDCGHEEAPYIPLMPITGGGRLLNIGHEVLAVKRRKELVLITNSSSRMQKGRK